MSNERTPWDGFAEAALTTVLQGYDRPDKRITRESADACAEDVAIVADAMLAERAKRSVAGGEGVNAELLEACKSAIPFVLSAIEEGVDIEGFDPEQHALMKKLRAAIARATT